MGAQPEPCILYLCGIAPFTIFKWTNKAFTSSDTTWLQVIFELSTHLVLLVKLLTQRQPSKMGWNCMTNEGLYSLIIKNLSCFSLFASGFFFCYLGSGQRYMICVTLFCTCASQKTYCHGRIACDCRMAVGVFTCTTCKNVRHKSDTLGHCLLLSLILLKKIWFWVLIGSDF